MKRFNYYLFSLVILTACILISCKKDVQPYNPYADIIYPVNNINDNSSSPNSLTRTHEEVFEPKCNVLGCHDGSFEPDFRTPHSSFSTLVYHRINKNNLAQEFEYRVIPYDTANSVLWERITNCCFVNENDRMPQDNIGIAMPQEAIDQIGSWIMDGARDLSSNVANEPNALPNIHYFAVYDTTYETVFSDNKVDDEWYNPFLMPENTYVNIIFDVDDDNTHNLDLQYNKLLVSTDINDFSQAQEFQANCVDSEQYGYPFIISINSSVFSSNQQYFMRYYTKDENPQMSEHPENESEIYIKSIWSFIVQ